MMNALHLDWSLAITTASNASESVATVPAKIADRTIGNGLTWSDAFQFLGVGLVIVFLTLVSLWLICEIMGACFRTLDDRQNAKLKAEKALKSAPNVQALPAAPSVQSSCEPIPEAVFVAAVAAIMGDSPHRVVSVEKVAPGMRLPASNASDDIPLAVIAAAVSQALDGTPHRILSVRPVDMTWAVEGRRVQMSA